MPVPYTLFSPLPFLINEGQQSDDAGTLDGLSQGALLLCRQARNATRQNLSTLGDKFAEQVNVFVVDGIFGLDW